MSEKFTPGPWHAGHFADDMHPCNCTSILADGYMGSIAQITVGNGKPLSQGGNDAPLDEEAKANLRLIAAAPELFAALSAIADGLHNARAVHRFSAAQDIARAALSKARGLRWDHAASSARTGETP